jgi:hypothetical protein
MSVRDIWQYILQAFLVALTPVSEYININDLGRTMTIADEINELREEFDGCALVAFADLTAKMVLLKSSEKKIPQENLDHLCAEAAVLFKGATARLNKDAAPVTAIVADGEKSNIYLRDTADSEDVLCCVCGNEVDLTAFLAAARTRISQIASGNK